MHTLSVGDCISFAWNTFKQRPWILIGALLLSMIIAALPQAFGPHPTVGPDGQVIPPPASTLGTIVAIVSLLVSIGVSLGLMGSGGSILTVPVLIYLVGQDEKIAIAGSLLVVGAIAAVSGARAALVRQVDWQNVLWFGVPGMLGTYLGAMLGGIVSSSVQLLTFVAVMALAGVWMLKPPGVRGSLDGGRVRSPVRIVLDGLFVGVLTGFEGG